MAISLTKGQRINLSKEGGDGLNKIHVGLGWDPVTAKEGGGFFKKLFAGSGPDVDCDASVLMLDANDKLVEKSDTIYYGNLKSSCGSVIHTGDNLTGEGEGDDEAIHIQLQDIPKRINKLVFVVNIYSAKSRGQHFGMIQNAFIRVVDRKTNKELVRYGLSEDYSGKTALIVAEVSRSGGSWDFGAVGDGTSDESLSTIIARYR